MKYNPLGSTFVGPPIDKILKAFAFIVGLGVAQNAAAANLLVNGGFESPFQGPANGYAAYNVGTQYPANYITGWTVTQGNVDLTTAADFGPGVNTRDLSSVQDIDLIGDSSGTGGVFGGLSQSFATTAGQEYLLTFDYSHNNGSASNFAALVTVVDGHNTSNSLYSTTVSQANGPAPWVAYSADFTATSDLTTLSFVDTQGAFNAGIYLDDVSVDQVGVGATPLPAALPMFAGGLGFVGFLARRKKRNALAAA